MESYLDILLYINTDYKEFAITYTCKTSHSINFKTTKWYAKIIFLDPLDTLFRSQENKSLMLFFYVLYLEGKHQISRLKSRGSLPQSTTFKLKARSTMTFPGCVPFKMNNNKYSHLLMPSNSCTSPIWKMKYIWILFQSPLSCFLTVFDKINTLINNNILSIWSLTMQFDKYIGSADLHGFLFF